MAATFWAGPRVYFQRIWQFRYFWFSLVQMDLRDRYRRSFLGIGWSLVRPLAMCTLFCMVFGKLFGYPLAEYAPFLVVSLTIWQFLVETSLMGCDCFLKGKPYIHQHPIPLAIFPLRTVLGTGFHGILALTVALGLTCFFKGLHPIGNLPLILPGIILLLLLGWFVAIIGGMIHTHFPDTKHLVDIVLQALFYLTPILYKPESLRGRERFAWVVEINPLSHLLEVVRAPLIEGVNPPLYSLAVSLGLVSVAGFIAVLCLIKLERTLVFWV